MSAMMQCLSFITLAVLLLLQCSSYGAAEFQCENGHIPSDYCKTGEQSCFNKEKTVQFKLAFDKPPTVSLGFVQIDLFNGANSRLGIVWANSTPVVTAEQLSVTFNCWGNSKCYFARIFWMACGPVKCS